MLGLVVNVDFFFLRVNQALRFNGINDHVILPSIHKLGLTGSFTITTWFKVPIPSPTRTMPIVCTSDAALCLFLKNRFVLRIFWFTDFFFLTLTLIISAYGLLAVYHTLRVFCSMLTCYRISFHSLFCWNFVFYL